MLIWIWPNWSGMDSNRLNLNISNQGGEKYNFFKERFLLRFIYIFVEIMNFIKEKSNIHPFKWTKITQTNSIKLCPEAPTCARMSATSLSDLRIWIMNQVRWRAKLDRISLIVLWNLQDAPDGSKNHETALDESDSIMNVTTPDHLDAAVMSIQNQ